MKNYISGKWISVISVILAILLITNSVKTYGQNYLIKGAVKISTTPVKYALVTFTDNSNITNKFSALTDSAGIFKLSILISSVSNNNNLPSKFELEQNYPNPFSNSTALSYKLKTPSEARITIYDILGREVRRFTTDIQTAGVYKILWNGNNNFGQKVTPGVYFYRLQAGEEAQVKKMVFGTGEQNVFISTPKTYSSQANETIESKSLSILGKTFTVQIVNTDTTSPTIIAKEFSNVAVQSDTTLNFEVSNYIPPTAVFVYSDSTQQFIRGFGAANIIPWRPDMTTNEVYKAFGTGSGEIGMSILRLRVPYNDTEAEFKAQVTTAKLAEYLGAIVFASPWTPPPSLKSNNNIIGGVLKDSSYAAYAAHLKAFADYMSNNGAPLYAISLQNEPDANVSYESCSWSAAQFLKFMKNNAASIGTRIIMPESQNFVHSLSDATLNDSTAAANVSIIGGHIYGGGLTTYPLAVSKGKEIWMTEHLILDTTWSAVLGTGKEIHDCMIAGMNAYVWWYIIRYYGPIDENEIVTKRGYVMSQFARFIRPGFSRIEATKNPQTNVYVSAYKKNSNVVLVVLNTGSTAIDQVFTINNGAITTFTPYITTASKNCVQENDITVANGYFRLTLEPSSITTFVSK